MAEKLTWFEWFKSFLGWEVKKDGLHLAQSNGLNAQSFAVEEAINLFRVYVRITEVKVTLWWVSVKIAWSGRGIRWSLDKAGRRLVITDCFSWWTSNTSTSSGKATWQGTGNPDCQSMFLSVTVYFSITYTIA